MKKFIIALLCMFLITGAVCLGVGLNYDYQKVDTVYINEVVQSIDRGVTPERLVYRYALFDRTGALMESSVEVEAMPLKTRISKAIADGDLVIDYGDDGAKLIFYLNGSARYYAMRDALLWLIFGSFALLGAVTALGGYMIYARTIKPFNNLASFAGEVARGNLDSPILLDKNLSFGAFGEAFDIMRNNLRESRLAEQKAMTERTRLLQEIGHEIKTPLSTIKAVAECGQEISGDESYGIILNKATVIGNMVDSFYHKALEEEGQLNIFLTKHSVQDFIRLIREADYNGRATIINECELNIVYDNNRMAQIADNIIANSYKYADTDIKVEITEEQDRIKVRFRDYGEGVPDEQLSYIMDRFYRGAKTEEKPGQGLGLNICRKLIVRMGGDMVCYNDNGFVVELTIPVLQKY